MESNTAKPARTQVLRDERGRLVAGGANLNPGGRPKGLEKLVRDMVDWPQATQFLIDVCYGKLSSGTAVRDRIMAYKLLAERGHGLPKQTVAIENDGALVQMDLSHVPDESLAEWQRLLDEEREAGELGLAAIDAASVEVEP